MDKYSIIALSFALSLHVFAVGVKSGIFRCQTTKEWIRTSFFFALFQTAFYALGWFTASGITPLIKSLSQPLGIVLLLIIGFKIIITSFDPRKDPSIFNVSNLRLLLILSVATSINAFLLGLSLGLINVGILPVLYFIAGLSLILAIAGILLGKIAGKVKMSIQADIFGGSILLILGVYLLLQYLGYLNLN